MSDFAGIDSRLVKMILILAVIATIRILWRRWRFSKADSLTDDEFYRIAGGEAVGSFEDVIRERSYLAKLTGIPAHYLNPTMELESLQPRFGFVGDVSVGVSQLWDEIDDLKRDLGENVSESQIETIADWMKWKIATERLEKQMRDEDRNALGRLG